MRDNPAGNVVSSLRSGEEIDVLEEQGDWAKTDKGWVSRNFLKPVPTQTETVELKPVTQVGKPAAAAPSTPVEAARQAAAGLSDAVVASIMRSEGPKANQGGIEELYGFRAHENTGYKEIKAAIAEYGNGSPEVKQVVGDLLRKRAERAGATKFSDPGVQAAIMSMAHMRGEGGARAITNMLAGSPLRESSKVLEDDAITAINAMKPEDFHEKLREARLKYDKAIHGAKHDSIKVDGQTRYGIWWDLFSHGLNNRYGRESQEFLALSKGEQAPKWEDLKRTEPMRYWTTPPAWWKKGAVASPQTASPQTASPQPRPQETRPISSAKVSANFNRR